MNKIYAGQTSLAIRAHTGCSLTDVEACEIRYRKPDGTEDAFPAVVLDSLEGVISYDVASGDIDIHGWWCFWAWVQFTGGKQAPGEPQKVFIYKEGR